MDWKEKEPDIQSIDITALLEKMSFIDGLRLMKLAKDSPVVLFNYEAREKIYSHLNTEDTELGGLLIGKVYSTSNLFQGIIAIEIFDSIPSGDFDTSPVSLKMNSEVWTQASVMIDTDKIIVGWYHSHPNLGVFFSGTDRYTQRHFFNYPYNVGLVIDPIRNEEKYFIGGESQETRNIFIV